MSGHSKWHNIQQKKGKTDAARANIFTKIGREIAVAVKDGGADPNSNSKLAQVIAKAKDNNMPNDNIMRSIKKASGELGSINYEDMTYEGYGVGGTAIIVEALTDNKNRTAGDVRHLFDKFGGSMGTTGCVSFMFKRRGIITIAKADIEEDDLMMYALELEGFEDINSEDDEVFEVYTDSASLQSVRKSLEDDGVKVLSAEVSMIPDNYVTPTPEQQATIMLFFIVQLPQCVLLLLIFTPVNINPCCLANSVIRSGNNRFASWRSAFSSMDFSKDCTSSSSKRVSFGQAICSTPSSNLM